MIYCEFSYFLRALTIWVSQTKKLTEIKMPVFTSALALIVKTNNLVICREKLKRELLDNRYGYINMASTCFVSSCIGVHL